MGSVAFTSISLLSKLSLGEEGRVDAEGLEVGLGLLRRGLGEGCLRGERVLGGR